MARGRLISKSLGSSRKFHSVIHVGGKLGEFCQVLFPLIVANTDDFGRMAGDAFTIKNVVLPSSRRSEQEFERALGVMHDVQLIARYVVEGAIYLQVIKFDEHQPGLTKRTKSKFPEIPADSGIAGNLPLNLTEFKRRESNGREENPEPARRADGLFDLFWAAYPKKKSKDDARRAWHKRRPDDALLAVMLRAIERQQHSPDWQREGGRFVPHPATWLNDGRWMDEVQVDVPAGEVLGPKLIAANGSSVGHRARARTPTAESNRPIFIGQRLVVLEWMFSKLQRTLGSYADAMQWDLWFQEADRRAMAEPVVVTEWGPWLQSEVLIYARQQGWAVAEPQASGKPTLSARMASVLASIAAAEGR